MNIYPDEELTGANADLGITGNNPPSNPSAEAANDENDGSATGYEEEPGQEEPAQEEPAQEEPAQEEPGQEEPAQQ